MKKLGLSLGGGGAKGAYQVGVWKYLSDIGLTEHISVIAGTSVGALNAVLFETTTLCLQHYLWTQKVSFANMLELRSNIVTEHQLIPDGLFSRDGLENLINEYINLDKIKHSGRSLYAACYNRSQAKTTFFRLNDYDGQTINSIIKASSALPYIYPSVKIGRDFYLDGGIIDEDNIPTVPLRNECVSDAIVVGLNPDDIVSRPPASSVIIRPSEYIGGPILSVMNFTGVKASYLIKLGYHDADLADTKLAALCMTYCPHILQNVDMQDALTNLEAYFGDCQPADNEVLLLKRTPIADTHLIKIQLALYNRVADEISIVLCTRYAETLAPFMTNLFGSHNLAVLQNF